MSTQQRNDACVIAVDPSIAATLRHQTLVVLEANHHYYEELLEYGPDAQHALSVIYRDAFAVLDAIGWHPNPNQSTVEAPLTTGHLEQLRRRRYDLMRTNLDRLPPLGQPMPAEIDTNRTAAHHLATLIARAENPKR
jgi:hypothetical protein